MITEGDIAGDARDALADSRIPAPPNSEIFSNITDSEKGTHAEFTICKRRQR